MLLTASASTFHAPVANNIITTLTSNIGALTSIIPVSSTNGFPAQGVFSIGDEVVYYSSKNAFTFLGCTRGYDGTTGAMYASGTIVELRWVAAHHNSIVDELLRVEQALGASVTGSTVSVDARFQHYDDTTAATPTFPTSPRLGAMFYASSPQQWYVYNGSGWDMVSTTISIASIAHWALNSISAPNYIFPTSSDLVDVGTAALFNSNSLAGYLNSLSGLGMLGREGDNFDYRTPDNKLVTVVESDKVASPRLVGFGIDFPIVNKISAFAAIPDGNRNINDIYMAIAGTQGTCTISINKLRDSDPVANYTTISLCSATLYPETVSAFKSTGAYNTTPGGLTWFSQLLYTPSVGEAGTITVVGEGKWGHSWTVITSATTYAGASLLDTVGTNAYATYTYNKTDSVTLNLTLLSSTGAYASYLGSYITWDLLNSAGVVAATWSLDTMWNPGLYPGIPPYPDLGFPYISAGSDQHAKAWLDLDATILYDDPNIEQVGLSSIHLGSWSGTEYSISAGDVLFAKVESITGNISRVSATVEAPYYIA